MILSIGLATPVKLSSAYLGCWIISLWAAWMKAWLSSYLVLVLFLLPCGPEDSRRNSSSSLPTTASCKAVDKRSRSDWLRYNIRESSSKLAETECSPNMTAAVQAYARRNGKYPWSFSSLANILPTDFHSASCYFGDSNGILTSAPSVGQSKNTVQKAAYTSLKTPSADGVGNQCFILDLGNQLI